MSKIIAAYLSTEAISNALPGRHVRLSLSKMRTASQSSFLIMQKTRLLIVFCCKYFIFLTFLKLSI